MHNERDLPVEFHRSCVVDSEELVYTCHLGHVVGLAFLFFFQNELVYRVVLRFCQFKGLHDLETSFPESRTATFGDMAVYAANDIVFYLAGQDFTYGEGTEKDSHTQSEADAHTVVHITKPGRYVVSGTLSQGQIAIDLGEGAKEDPNAVVTLVLNGADITCSVAPAVIFYEVYECCSSKEEDAKKDVNTSRAGANVIIADGTENYINGSYVAKIYKSYELSADGKQIVDSKKLHKYDAAFYSRMSMNISGGNKTLEGETSSVFTIQKRENQFSNITILNP